MTALSTAPHPAPLVVRGMNVAAKVALLLLIALVIVNPDYGNLEGKAPEARAITYPLLAFTVPVLWWLIGRDRARYPWVADLLVTLPAFSDILGNRLDLYDTVLWFDDWMHVMNVGLLSAAVVLLTLDRTAGPVAILERSLAFAWTAVLGWELFEYLSFVRRSAELEWAYVDTLGDIALGWFGAVCAAVAVHALRRRGRLRSVTPLTGHPADR